MSLLDELYGKPSGLMQSLYPVYTPYSYEQAIPGQRSTSVAQPEPTMQDRVMGTIETPAIVVGGLGKMVAGPVARFLGGYPLNETSKQRGLEAQKTAEAQFYQPRTETGPAIVDTMAKVLGSLPLTPLTSAGTALSTLSGPASRQLLSRAPRVAQTVSQGTPTSAATSSPASVVRSVGNLFKSEDSQMAEKLAEQIGIPKDELVRVLSQQGPQLIEGYQKTVPQILQDPLLSQLQRNLKTAGVQNLGEAEKL